ncbi:hypothetical protein VPH35_021907 [Triticum aestivum]|uniref:Uncharacterized protein n=1 Tax=Triticum turgidum subsp. durum TaxID=4567 RepID=A0A9R1R9J3_TRITD|nr:unnamed protein product [Triticum turgidum subsp. durum]
MAMGNQATWSESTSVLFSQELLPAYARQDVSCCWLLKYVMPRYVMCYISPLLYDLIDRSVPYLSCVFVQTPQVYLSLLVSITLWRSDAFVCSSLVLWISFLRCSYRNFWVD